MGVSHHSPSSLAHIQQCGMQEHHRWKFPLTYDDLGIVITFYSPSCFDQWTAKVPFGLRVKLPPVYHTRRRLLTVPFIAERQAGSCEYQFFIVFDLTRRGIEPESTASVADILSTQPLIGKAMNHSDRCR